MKYLAQIVFIQILWHQFYKLYNNNLNANIFIQIIFLSMKLNVHWNHPLWLNTPFTFCDSPIEIIPSSRRVPTILPEWFFLHKKTFNYLNKIIQWICHYFHQNFVFEKMNTNTHTHTQSYMKWWLRPHFIFALYFSFLYTIYSFSTFGEWYIEI